MNQEKLFNQIVSFLKKIGVTKIAIFGSFVKKKTTPESDIDILVEFSGIITLFEFVRIERELSEELNMKVHLLTEKFISPYIFDDIKKEMVVIY